MPLPTFLQKMINPLVEQQVRNRLAVAENDNTFYGNNNMSAWTRDRYDYDRHTIFSECLRAWRVNPIARWLVTMISAFVVGEGLSIESEHKATNKFLQAWWSHELNDFDSNVIRWLDEQSRTGNLFFLFSVDDAGMSYVRAVPADLIKEIQHAENDIEQETFYIPHDINAPPWVAYNPQEEQDSFMVHIAVNKPVGTCWGEPDLATQLPWIGRFSAWLEDRARLNRFRNAFVWFVTKAWKSEADKKARQAELNAKPPAPGSILLADADETWEAKSPKLDASDAEADGLALKKMISMGRPLHYLAEPESSTRTTAEAAGTPTFRNFAQIQTAYKRALTKLAKIAVTVRKRYDKRVNPNAAIKINAPDITEKDNSSLALAVNRTYPAAVDMYDRRLIDENELLRVMYRMMGETFQQNEEIHGKRRPLAPITPTKPEPSIPTEPDPGEPGEDEDEASAQKNGYALHNLTVNMPPSEIVVNVPKQEAVQHEAAEQPIINVQVNPTPVTVAAPVVTVRAPHVTNEIKIPTHTESLVVERDEEGRATKIEKTIKQD